MALKKLHEIGWKWVKNDLKKKRFSTEKNPK